MKPTPREVVAWRVANDASIAQTAKHFSISRSTVSRHWEQAGLPNLYLYATGTTGAEAERRATEWRDTISKLRAA